MSRWWDDSETQERRIWRAVLVGEYHPDEDVTAMDYLRATSEW